MEIAWLRRRWLSVRDERAVQRAIATAEEGNRGEVRVHLEAGTGRDPLDRARELFDSLGMTHTRDDTGVLLYVAVRDRRVAVYAGAGVHGATESHVWRRVAESVAAGFARGHRREGLIAGLELIGTILRERAPGEDSAGNELPDEVSMG